jgi:hypothetical protein
VGNIYRGRKYQMVEDRVGKLNLGRKLPVGRRPALIVSIEVGLITMRRRPAWIVSEVGTTKGWVCGVTEEDSDWLGS